MPHHRVVKTLLAFAAVSIVLVAIPACSAVEEIAYQRHSSSFENVSAMEDEGDLEVMWLPADATSIRVLESTREGVTDTSVVLVDSAAELDPAVCAPIDRLSGPALSIDGAPDVYALDSVFACGKWTVAPAPDGWYGWTPNHPDEEAQTPAR